MSDTNQTETETGTNTNTDEPSKAELHERVEQLESTVAKMMPSRRDALRMGVAGLAGAAGLGAASQSAEAATGSAGQIGDSSNRPDAFLDEANVNQLTGVSTGGDRQGCRVTLSSSQSISASGSAKVQFDTKIYDSDNNFDTSTHEWTCPKDGIYMAVLQLRYSGGSGRKRVIIGNASNAFPNGEGAMYEERNSENTNRRATTINKYQSGDTIVGYARNDGANDTVEGGDDNISSYFEVAFLGGL